MKGDSKWLITDLFIALAVIAIFCLAIVGCLLFINEHLK